METADYERRAGRLPEHLEQVGPETAQSRWGPKLRTEAGSSS